MHHPIPFGHWPMRWQTGLVLCALLGASLAPAQAAEVRWRTAKYQYQTKGQDLRDFLRSFAANHQLIAFYRRLVAAGKPPKLALIACARKLVIYANTVLARGTPWEKQSVPA